ncbi:MAG: alpha/beta hydrolase [Bacteroidota bacterium]
MKTFYSLILLLFAGSVFAQSSSEKLPPMADWFLATGDWQTDPQLYVREYGRMDQEPIIMLHGGWGGNYVGMVESVKDLFDTHHFVFYDQRGSLHSPCPDSLITYDHHIEDLERLRKELKLDKLTLVGHSMGAILASAYAARYPKHIQKLVLLAPPALKSKMSKEEALEISVPQNDALQAFIERPAIKQELEKYALNASGEPLSSREHTAIFRINFAKRMLFDVSKWPALTGGRALYKGKVFSLTAASYPQNGWDFISDFQQQSYPIHVIVGDHDFLDFGNGLIKKWGQEVPGMELSVIKEAGHILWIDQPTIFTSELQKALKD